MQAPSQIKIPKNTSEIVSFITVDAKKPKKDPNADFNACGPFVLLKTISPIKAPKNGPIKIPNGIGESIPIINPNTAPTAPALLPPNFLVLMAGII